MWRSGILSPTGRATAKNALAVLVVCGQGVVTKPEGCQVVARVEADPETFLWSSAGGATSFVRRERLQSVLAVLAAEGCVPVAVYCTDAAADFGQAAGVYARQLGDTLGWRMLVRLTPKHRPSPGAGEAAGISGAGVVPAVACGQCHARPAVECAAADIAGRAGGA